jgi:hypothetical protein
MIFSVKPMLQESFGINQSRGGLSYSINQEGDYLVRLFISDQISIAMFEN